MCGEMLKALGFVMKYIVMKTGICGAFEFDTTVPRPPAKSDILSCLETTIFLVLIIGVRQHIFYPAAHTASSFAASNEPCKNHLAW